MGVWRKGAERRPVALTVEALEDRFLLSGAVPLSVPAPAQENSAILVAPANIAAGKERTGSVINGTTLPPVDAKVTLSTNYVSLIYNAPINSSGYQRDGDDGDEYDLPDRMDGDPSRKGVPGFSLLSFASANSAGDPDLVSFSRLPERLTVASANLLGFLPSLSASGLGAAGTVPHAPLPPAAAASGEAPGNYGPARGGEEKQPTPQVPEVAPSTLPPLADEKAAPPPSFGVPFIDRLPIDAEAIQRGVDAFFQQLGDLSEEWRDGRVLEKLAPWLLAATVAGYGWVRLRDHCDRRFADPAFFLPGKEG